jgi:hypothetical protein
MIEIFRTSVYDRFYAGIVIGRIHSNFPEYRANFDLADCDRILRVCSSRSIDVDAIIKLVTELGFSASLLEDKPVSVTPSRQ